MCRRCGARPDSGDPVRPSQRLHWAAYWDDQTELGRYCYYCCRVGKTMSRNMSKDAKGIDHLYDTDKHFRKPVPPDA